MGKDAGQFVPENVTLSTKGQLEFLIGKAEAPRSERKMGVVMGFANGTHTYGYNTENSDRGRRDAIIHAESRALEGIAPGAPLQTVDLMVKTEGLWTDIKYALPCRPCTGLLTPYATSDTQISLHNADYPDKQVSLTFEELQESYKPYPEVPGPVGKDIDAFLAQHTPLSPIDRSVLTIMGSTIREEAPKTEVYLTGTASGRSGPRSLIVPKFIDSPYLDIDLAIITPFDDSFDVIHTFAKLFNNVLTAVEFEHTGVRFNGAPSYRFLMGNDTEGSGFRVNYFTYNMFHEVHALEGEKKDQDIPSAMDVSFGNSHESVLTDDYLKENRYIRIL